MDNSSRLLVEFTLIYNRYKSGLYYYIYKMVNDRTLSEDIVQITFMKFYENFDTIHKDSAASWLYSTARNEIYQHLRKKKRNQEFPDEFIYDRNSETNLMEEYEQIEIKRIIQFELSNLPDDQKEIYLMKEYSGLSYKEIAGILLIDEDLVKSRLFKVRQKLIKRISKLV